MEREYLKYFGTNLTSAGHYLFQLGDGFYHFTREQEYKMNFNPEGLVKNQTNGTANYVTVNGLNIIAIAGSPKDTRGGCKSVFWMNDKTTFEELKELIMNTPASKKIIEQMPFTVQWKEDTNA